MSTATADAPTEVVTVEADAPVETPKVKAAPAVKEPTDLAKARANRKHLDEGGAEDALPWPAVTPAIRKSDPKPCLCGCGGTTKGGSFVQGHDAKYKSILVGQAIKAEAADASDADKTLGEAAVGVLAERNWTKFLDKAREVALTKASTPKREPKPPKGDASEAAADEKAGALTDRMAQKDETGNRLVAVGATVSFQYRGASQVGKVTAVAGNKAQVEWDIEGGKTEKRAFALAAVRVIDVPSGQKATGKK